MSKKGKKKVQKKKFKTKVHKRSPKNKVQKKHSKKKFKKKNSNKSSTTNEPLFWYAFLFSFPEPFSPLNRPQRQYLAIDAVNHPKMWPHPKI
mgnify:CR=1 FL=1